MNIRPHRIIKRKKTRKIKVGNIYIGGDSPISVQSMTNTLTTSLILSLDPMLPGFILKHFAPD